MKNRLLSDWYAKGYGQQLFIMAVSAVLIFIAGLLLGYLCKAFVWQGLSGILGQYGHSLQDLQNIKLAIMADSSIFGLQVIACVLIVVALIFTAIMFAARINLAGPVMLDKALRFTDAMERLGLVYGWEQFQFIQNYKVPVYIAETPLMTAEAEEIKARRYIVAHSPLASTTLIDAEKGRKRLCLKEADLNAAMTKLHAVFKPQTDETQEPVPGPFELRQQVAALETDKKVFQKELTDARNKITELETANAGLAKDLKGFTLRAGRADRAQEKIFIYSMALAPIFQKIVAGKPDRRDVTKKVIGQLFKLILERDGTLQGRFIEVEGEVPQELPDYICELIWNSLKSLDLASDGGAAPTGNLSRLKKIIFTEGPE